MNQVHVTWSAPAFDHREHGADWYWAVSIIAVSLTIAFFIVGNALLSLIMILGVSTLLFHAKQPPEILEYEISRQGIRAGKTFFLWETLESFWITEEHMSGKDHVSAKLLITSQKPLMPRIVIPLTNAPLENVHNILSQMLPEEPQMEPFPDRVMRKLGF